MGRVNPTRFCIVDTQDGVAEFCQSIISIDDAVLYLHLQGPLLAVQLHPSNRVHIIDLQVLGPIAFGVRQDFNPAQADATTAEKTDDISRDRGWSDIGRLPSLKAILESPSIPKVLFDCRPTTSTLHRQYQIGLRGVEDVQLMELASGRPTTLMQPLQFHRKGMKVPELRDLRACLE